MQTCRRGVALYPRILRWDVYVCCSLGGFSISFCSWVGWDSAYIWRSAVLYLLLGGTRCVFGLNMWNNLELTGEMLVGSSVCGGEVFYSLRSVAMRGPSFRSRFFAGFSFFPFFPSTSSLFLVVTYTLHLHFTILGFVMIYLGTLCWVMSVCFSFLGFCSILT